MFHGWKNTWGFEPFFEIDYMILSKKLKLIVIVECKRSKCDDGMNKAKMQLEKITNFFLRKIPIRTKGWKMIKTLAYSYLHKIEAKKMHFCERCTDYVWEREQVDLSSWWRKLTNNVMVTSPETEADDMNMDVAIFC